MSFLISDVMPQAFDRIIKNKKITKFIRVIVLKYQFKKKNNLLVPVRCPDEKENV